MRKSWLVCVLLGTLAWGQAAPNTPSAPQAGAPNNMARPQAPALPPDTSDSVPPNAAVITIDGVCPAKPKPVTPKAATGTSAKPATAAKTASATTSSADCKTVITKAQFEKMETGVAANVTPQLKKQLAGVLPKFIAMSNAAEKKGLDKTPRFMEMMKFARLQILSTELQRNIQEEAAKVPPEEINKYYKEHAQNFQQFNVDRLFVPRSKSPASEAKEEDEKDEKASEEAQRAKEAEEKAKAEENEQAMTKLADSLRARAAAGEDFIKLQKEAFEAAGMKIESPTVNLPTVRTSGLPAAHASAFELNAGEVSQVIHDSGGHYIYKMNSKQELPLDKVESEIHSTLQNQRTREMMDKVSGSFKVETNEAYFGPGAASAPPPQRMPNPRMAPGPVTPQPKPQTPPATQPPAKPN